ncbi:Phosphatidylinositol 4-phosphate 5-kinase 1 [Hondaea fermentalgiana]|uniref:Phosphatidylinositol 4-phosphate 5-kinase 1 n=1 Tax=Hondaea fermentalgiana TaxID=2315210 RepID=A0A2R5G7J2_9STRA|nr:Phosphatidylinositol 4-phosphate 5-kinase 1 [Hondaea fermentalgiana]|eukprot:GBG27022.1 Phosphatidylinositol 4-phosphate 5-kinase 1 [Hondaea fermentalgiana]
MVELAKPQAALTPTMPPAIPSLGCLSTPPTREEDRKKAAAASASAPAPVPMAAPEAVSKKVQQEQPQPQPQHGVSAGDDVEVDHSLPVSPLAKSPESEHTDAHSVDISHADHGSHLKRTDVRDDEIHQAKRDADTVNVVGKITTTPEGRLTLTGAWHFQESVLGDISYVMETQHHQQVSTVPLTKPGIAQADDVGSSAAAAAATVGTPAAETKNETIDSDLIAVPENTECVWSGTFSMANPAYGERKKKRRSTKKTLSVPEKFLVTFVRRCACKGSPQHGKHSSGSSNGESETPSAAEVSAQDVKDASPTPAASPRHDGENEDCECKDKGAIDELSVEGFGRNRFGRFTLRGTLHRKSGVFRADKAYVPRDACGGGPGGASTHGERVVGRKNGRSESIEMDRCLDGIRASKRQRVPNRMLMLDTNKRSYAFIAKHGNGSSRGSLTPNTTCAIFDSGALSPDVGSTGRMFYADGTSEFPMPFDYDKADVIRKRAQRATVTLVRQLIQEQRHHVKQVRRLSSAASVASGVSASSSAASAAFNAPGCGGVDGLGSRRVSAAQIVPFVTAESAAARPETFSTGVGQVYDGEVDDLGRRHGYGICLFENGMIFEGMWCRGKMSGKGMLVNACGELVYQGEFADNCMSGRGTYLFESGDRYDGEFREGRFHGHGVYFHAPSGATFVGDWRRGERHGVGDLYMPDGSGYSGDWSKDQWSGRGILNVKDLCYYDGQFRAHKFDGRGDCFYGTGAGSFTGAFRGGLKEGRGTYSFPNGAVYEGRFRGDGIEGFGTFKMTRDRAEKVDDGTWFLPVSCQSEMRFVHRAAGF